MHGAQEPHVLVNNITPIPACHWCRGCVIGLCMALAGCSSSTGPGVPPNLSTAKAEVKRYQDSGAYERDLEASAVEILRWLEDRVARARPEERLAVVFDIDETVLSNATVIRNLDFGYIPAAWEEWVASASAPAIKPLLGVYQRCQDLGIHVFFVTGRRDPEHREATKLNLEREGMGRFEGLYLARREDAALGTRGRKTASRRDIESKGFVIIANIGDQQSDLDGGHAERSFKVENPFYLME